MLNRVLIYLSLLVTVLATNGSRSQFPTPEPGPENKCCYEELKKFVDNGLDSPKIFQVLVHPKHDTCPPHGPEHPKHNWNLANLTKCLSTCMDMYNSSNEFVYAKHLVNALKFTMLVCQRKFEKVEKFLYNVSKDKDDKCQEQTEAMVSSINNVHMTWENFEDTCKARVVALECWNQAKKDGSIVQEVEQYLYGLQATVYYILEAQEAANDQPDNHTISSLAKACKVVLSDTMHYLEADVTVPSVSMGTNDPVVEPDHNETKGDSSDATTQNTEEVNPSLPSGSPSSPTGNDTTATNAVVDSSTTKTEVVTLTSLSGAPSSPTGIDTTATDVNGTTATNATGALPNGPAQSTVLPPNATGNSGNSNKCVYGFDRFTIVMALTVVLGVILPAAVDIYQP